MSQERSSMELKHLSIKPGVHCWQIAEDQLDDNLRSGGWLTVLAQRLLAVAAEHPDQTLYCATWVGPSSDFHMPAFSTWLSLSGSQELKKLVGKALGKLIPHRWIRDDFTGSSQTGSWGALYIDSGQVWLPADAASWVSVDSVDVPNAVEPTEEDDTYEDESTETECAEESAAVVSVSKLGIRVRAARGDASVGAIQATIEKIFKLPEGSVKLTNPDMKFSRSNQSIGRLRKRWDK